MSLADNYLEQVYAGVLGKVIGVYVGRPIEGWEKKNIEAKFGEIDRYVHEEQDTYSEKGVPLIVADDDITGAFTFVRTLEDSGLYANTPPEFYGETWLNYLVEKKTILWWGGMGHSTEHTAYLRLKNGIKAPRSGSRLPDCRGP
jgi:ADP-ribosylglycohydrolase